MKKYIFTVFIFLLVIGIFMANVSANDQYDLVNNEIFHVSIGYEYNRTKNTVIVKAVSNRELIQKTLPGWILGADKKTYTAEYNTNQKFNTFFTDKNGNKVEKQIDISLIDDKGPEVKVVYSTNSEKTLCTITVTSNEEMIQKTLPGWVLSTDKKVYTATYNMNQTFETYFTDIYGNKTLQKIVINQIDQDGPPTVNIKYEYDSSKNVVIVKATSNRELIQKTLPGWVLSLDKKSYIAEYDTNQTFSTYFTDIYGNKAEKQIVISDINQTGLPTVEIQYEYNSSKNIVMVKAKANRKLKQKKLPGWILSEDKMSYTAEYDTNQTFNTYFTDIYGNKVEKQIIINKIDDQGPILTISYFYDKNTNRETVIVESNEVLKQKTLSGWTLSADRKTYTATYDRNQEYDTYFTDIYGNKTLETINISQVDDKGPEVKVKYSFNSARTVCTVTVTSDEEMKQKTLPGWVLSSDKLTYTAIYTTNQIFKTNFTDKWGNITIVPINIVFNIGIDVSQHNGKINWLEVKNSGVSFAILRCGYGANIAAQDDPTFAINVAECERLGIPYGIYLYSYALNETSAESEADHVLRLIKSTNAHPTYGVWIDMEDADEYKLRYGMPSNETLVNICSTFCDKLISNGYNAGIYASLYWLNTQLDSSKLDKYDKWVAQWNTHCDYEKNYSMWQYTSKGSVNGILTDVDMNIYYK